MHAGLSSAPSDRTRQPLAAAPSAKVANNRGVRPPVSTADKDVKVSFTSEGAPPLVLKLRGLTGAVTNQPEPAGKQP